MKSVYIIHGWGGSPKEEIHKWLKSELEKNGFKVNALKMPNSETPRIEEWIPFLQKNIPVLDKQTYLVGHSIGCQAILRYLETLPKETKVRKVILIAPWINLLDTAYENPDEEKKIAKPWIETPINWEKCKSHTKHFTAIFSDNDFCVPLSDKEIFRKKLNAKIIVEHNKGHFTMEDNVDKVPSALSSILEISH